MPTSSLATATRRNYKAKAPTEGLRFYFILPVIAGKYLFKNGPIKLYISVIKIVKHTTIKQYDHVLNKSRRFMTVSNIDMRK